MAKLLSSPLVSASNNIVLFAKGTKQLPRVQRQLVQFDQFIRTKTVELEKLKLPDKKKIKELAKLNIASSFGAPGGLLKSLVSGALDVAGFLGNMFPSKGKTGKPGKVPKKIKVPKPVVRGSKLKLGGIRAVGVVNALFAGLDFATGLQEGESVGKAAAGAGGSLAGSLLGGVIGQTLIPIPGVGFVLGSMAGGFLGGYAADRVYEGGSSIKKKLSERLKKQEVKQRAAASGDGNFGDIVSKFSSAVSKFEQGISSGLFGTVEQVGNKPMEDVTDSVKTSYDTQQKDQQQTEPGETYSAEGGDKPSSNFTSAFGQRWGRQHNGVDFASPSASAPVSVIQPGIIDTGYESGYGNWVAVKHDNGAETFYGHLSKVNVVKGQRIEAGTVIGNQGKTGRSTGPHVHFEYRPKGPGTNAVDGRGIADNYFRFGGNIKVKKSQEKKTKTDADKKLGEVSTDYQQKPKTGQQFFAEQKQITGIKPELQPSELYKDTKIQEMVKNPEKYKEGIGNIQGDKKMVVGKMYDDYQRYIKQQKIIPPQVVPTPQQSIQQYPTYNQQQSSVTIMPIMMGGSQGGGGGQQQKPVFIPVGGGGGGGTVILPGPSEGAILNSLWKTMLLTNLSAA
jgi:murein DD-endopeptidase MepM/ murein hydrolase activator NlpD